MKHANVAEAVVFGVPVNDYEQEVCAWVKLKSHEQATTPVELIKHCQAQLIDYMVPKFVKFVDSFPVNKMSKYMRSQMSKQYKIEIGL